MGLFSKLSLCFVALSTVAFAQFPISVGVKAGVPLTDAFTTTNGSVPLPNGLNGRAFSDARNYIVGPMVELKLPFHLSVEADGLFRPLNISAEPTGSTGTNVLNRISNNFTTWEFPIVGKYHFAFPIVSPYVEAGPSFRTRSSNIQYLSSKGFVFGAGADFKLLLLKISPEFRYTRWAGDNGVGSYIPIPSKQDQAEILVGFSF